MNAVRRMFSVFTDSPTYERDRANLISGFTIGTTGLLLNGAVLCFIVPLLASPDDTDFLAITERVGFGQTLALILLGGATIFATLLIPLRLVSIFWGPRIGRYFDQIVLSGISPIRFIIGKALSQNLFLGLILFLLLPYLVFSMTLGGVDWWFFLAGVFLVWLYCMTLAMVTLWVSLYLNELLAALAVIVGAGGLLALGSLPIPLVQPFCLTPMPVLLHPIYESTQNFGPFAMGNFETTFASCTVGMLAVLGTALFGIYLGPLFGIISDNSTFGEVVRAGDSRRKRRFRMRHHIQRPSELAFFYENRSPAFQGSDGILRWGLGLGALSAVLLLVHTGFYGLFAFVIMMGGGGRGMPEAIQVFNLIVLGVALILGVGLFAHAKNTMYQRTPFLLGRTVEVARIDTWCFFLFASLAIGLAVGMPLLMEETLFAPRGQTVFQDVTWQDAPVELTRLHIEGTAILALAGAVIYALHRHLCQKTWLRSVAFFSACGTYMFFVCMAPFLFLLFTMEVNLRASEWLTDWSQRGSIISPIMMFANLIRDLPPDYPEDISTLPFYAVHFGLLIAFILLSRTSGRKLRASYIVAAPTPPPTNPTPPSATVTTPATATEVQK